jgi:hypothetical protein
LRALSFFEIPLKKIDIGANKKIEAKSDKIWQNADKLKKFGNLL